MKRNGTERRYDVNGLDRCLVSFVPVPFIGSSGGGIAQVVHRSAVEQVVTLTAGVTVPIFVLSVQYSAIKCPLEITADDYFVTSNGGAYDAIQAAYIVLRIMGY